jgi:hypothetical protein
MGPNREPGEMSPAAGMWRSSRGLDDGAGSRRTGVETDASWGCGHEAAPGGMARGSGATSDGLGS